MAAPMKNFIFRKALRFLRFSRLAKENLVPIASVQKDFSRHPTKCDQESATGSIFAISTKLLLRNCQTRSRVFGLECGGQDLGPAVKFSGCSRNENAGSSDENFLFSSQGKPSKSIRNSCRQFSTSKGHSSSSSDKDNQAPSLRPLRLMNIRELIWPHPLKSFRNWFLSLLITGYMDQNFTQKVFMEGAEQAVCMVSALVASGRFDELDGLVAKEAIHEIRQNYNILSVRQRQMLAVNPRDVFFRFIYEIGMIFDDKTDKRFVEITTVLQGYHGMAAMRDRGQDPADMSSEMEKAKENMYVCNYRFIREFTKGVAETSDWTINKLNHFAPKDIVKRSNFFDR